MLKDSSLPNIECTFLVWIFNNIMTPSKGKCGHQIHSDWHMLDDQDFASSKINTYWNMALSTDSWNMMVERERLRDKLIFVN